MQIFEKLLGKGCAKRHKVNDKTSLTDFKNEMSKSNQILTHINENDSEPSLKEEYAHNSQKRMHHDIENRHITFSEIDESSTSHKRHKNKSITNGYSANRHSTFSETDESSTSHKRPKNKSITNGAIANKDNSTNYNKKMDTTNGLTAKMNIFPNKSLGSLELSNNMFDNIEKHKFCSPIKKNEHIIFNAKVTRVITLARGEKTQKYVAMAMQTLNSTRRPLYWLKLDRIPDMLKKVQPEFAPAFFSMYNAKMYEEAPEGNLKC